MLIKMLFEDVQLPQRFSSFMNFRSSNSNPVVFDHFLTLGAIFSLAFSLKKFSKTSLNSSWLFNAFGNETLNLDSVKSITIFF